MRRVFIDILDCGGGRLSVQPGGGVGGVFRRQTKCAGLVKPSVPIHELGFVRTGKPAGRLPASWTASTYSPAGRGSLVGERNHDPPFAFTVTETSASGSCSCEMSASSRKRNRLTETVPFPDTSRASVPAGAVVTNCAATVSSALSFTDAVAPEPANSETDACGATAEKAAVMTSAPFAGKSQRERQRGEKEGGCGQNGKQLFHNTIPFKLSFGPSGGTQLSAVGKRVGIKETLNGGSTRRGAPKHLGRATPRALSVSRIVPVNRRRSTTDRAAR